MMKVPLLNDRVVFIEKKEYLTWYIDPDDTLNVVVSLSIHETQHTNNTMINMIDIS